MGAALLPRDEQGSPPGCSVVSRMEEKASTMTNSEAQEIARLEESAALSPGSHMYLISMTWWEAWEAHSGLGPRGVAPGEHPGPMDNSGLVDGSGVMQQNGEPQLREGLKERIHYKLISTECWEKLQELYGGGPAIRRRLVRSNSSTQATAEVYGISISIVTDTASFQPQRTDLTLSAETTVAELKEAACQEMDLAADQMQVWDFYNGMKYKCLDDSMDKTLEECSIVEGQKILLERSTNSHGAQVGSDSSSSETNVLSPASDVATSLAPMTINNSSSTGLALTSSNLSRMNPQSGTTSFFSDSSTPSQGTERGLAGLSNLGNTCFMNSSLQCLSHTPALVSFFLSNQFREDINTVNPLGMKGELAEAFGSLLHDLWAGDTGSVAPRGFKHKLSHFAPQFSGYSQQDSQELLAFLLDGLHEDLNRIKDKPYIEDKDIDDRADEEVAAEAWHNYRQRNDSCIVDHFQGLYKSCLVCPTCSHSSVKFDPFMYLSLPLPTTAKRFMTVTLVATDGAAPPTQYCLQVPKKGTVADLEAALCTAASVPEGEEVAIAEISFHRVRRMLTLDQDLRGIGSSSSLTSLGNPLVAYRRQRLPEGKPCLEVHVLHRQAGAARHNLLAAPLLLWFPQHTAQDMTEEPDVSQEQLETALSKALRPFRKARRKAEGGDSMDVSMASKSSASVMAVDPPDPAAATTSGGCLGGSGGAVAGLGDVQPETAARGEMESASKAPPDANSKAPVAMDVSEPVATSSGGALPADSATNAQPFDMWAGQQSQQNIQPAANAQLMSPTGRANVRKRPAPYQLRACDSWGDVNASDTGRSSTRPIAVEYYVLEWEEDGGGIYDPALLEDPLKDESVDAAATQSEAPISLSSCLSCFLQHERLDPEDSWWCPKCKEHVQADKKLDLWSLPEVLVVHLKRFSYTSRLRDKLTSPVEFPLEGLDLSTYVLKEQGVSPLYDLFAVSNHMGGLGGGHYTAYSKQPGTSQWSCFDDSRVYLVDEQQVVSPNAYVLFYQRRNEAHDRNERLQQILNQ